MASNADNLIWLDLEMTGLRPDDDRILEIATVITDAHLHILAEGPVCAIWQAKALLDGMGKWCREHHGQSGLTDRVRASQVTEVQAEQQTLAFIKKYVPASKSPMCGSTICQDRRFLARYMPELESYFHYRNLDVSTLKELARRWAPAVYKAFDKDPKHLALPDIKDSINELIYYREHFIKV